MDRATYSARSSRVQGIIFVSEHYSSQVSTGLPSGRKKVKANIYRLETFF
jgi:hypothetical protein